MNPLDTMRDIIQEDVGSRGLRAQADANLIDACPGDFAAACRSIADTPDAAVAIVTGFYIPHAEPPCGETDGPLGAIFLARALVPLGIRVVLATDKFCRNALDVGLYTTGLRKLVSVVTLPESVSHEHLSPQDYRQFFADRSGAISHLIALERVGPSHTPETFERQGAGTEEERQRFLHEVSADHYGRSHTMRGRDITYHMSPAHHLFEGTFIPKEHQEACSLNPPESPDPPITIGIGDGGNEIGMGKIAWDVIRRNIPGGGLVACRVPTDHLIVCGISNWGAYGLAAGIRHLKKAPADADLFDPERERELLTAMVEKGPLVDGVTGQPTVSVDGLDFDKYIEPLKKLAACCS